MKKFAGVWENYKIYAKNGRKVTRNGCLVLKPQGPMGSKRAVRSFDASPKSDKHTQAIVHDRITRGHTTLFCTGAIIT